jgi:general secretion pathway protein G
MKWLYNRLYKKQKGFTLVELMVVIIILAVLTGIAIPSYLALRNRAREQATRTEMQNIATALEIYNADIGYYPAGTADLSPDYMTNVPTNDAWGADYDYVVGESDSTYTLTSSGGDADIVMDTGQFEEE